MSENDVVNEAVQPETHTVATDKKLRNRLYELAAQMNEKDTSSGEDQESEPKTEPENQKENLSSEDNSQSVQEELQKVRAMQAPVDSSASTLGWAGRSCTDMCWVPKEQSLNYPSLCTRESPGKPVLMITRGSIKETVPHDPWKPPSLLSPSNYASSRWPFSLSLSFSAHDLSCW